MVTQLSNSNNAFTQGILDEFNMIVDTQLGHEVGPVSLNRLGADHQHISNLLRGVSLDYQLEHIPFPIGQLLIGIVTDSSLPVPIAFN